MSLRILFVASLHHPEQLRAAVASTPPGESPPLFPPSVSQHFYERALRRRGHVLDVCYDNLPLVSWGQARTRRYTSGLTPGKVLLGLTQRIPPTLNLDYRLRNRRLVEQTRAFRPHVLWMAGNYKIFPETLATIKAETGCKLVYTSGVSPIVFSNALERRAARLYDLALVNDFYHGVQWLELGAKRMECLPLSACDPDFHRPYELSDLERNAYSCDVAFVGTLVPDNLYSRRVAALEALCDFDLGIWSVHDVPASLRRFVRGPALGETMLRVLSAAKITINTHGDFMRYGGNMRLFEAAGAGVFQIADDLPGTRQWFTEGETIVTYRNTDDLRQKVAYFLEHADERVTIAQRAQAHVYAHHTYDGRVERIEALLDTL